MQVPSISRVQSLANQAIGYRSALTRSLNSTLEELKNLKSEDEILELTAALLRGLIDEEIVESKNLVQSLFTEALKRVFSNQNLSVRAEVAELRGKVCLNLITEELHPNGIRTEGLSVDCNGGSVTTVQSILMRIVTIIQRKLRPVLFLDESIPAFDPNYIMDMMEFLKTLCDRLGFDIVLVTQDRSLVEFANVAYDLKKSDGKAKISRIK